jgi:hypothetical protein
LEDSQQNPEDYIQGVREKVMGWLQAHRRKGGVYFKYRKGPGFIELRDNRPLGGKESAIRLNPSKKYINMLRREAIETLMREKSAVCFKRWLIIS